MSRLILVSHRLPTELTTQSVLPPSQRAAGGLVAALGPLWRNSDSIWIGVPGATGSAALPPRLIGLDIPAAMLKRYYDGFANSVLWPLFHYFVESVDIRPNDYDAYLAVNQRFADQVVAIAQPGDRIWVHDYHLLLLPSLIRERLPDVSIGFFLHIPFPSSEVYRSLPMAEELLHGLVGADLIGFHTYDYARHFVSSWRRITGGGFENGAVASAGRKSKVGVFPLGVDAMLLADRAASEQVTGRLETWKQEFSGRKVVLGVDRLDYTKGIALRLRAYRQLLESHPKWIQDVVFLQLAVPSRSSIGRYRALKREIEELVGQINGVFGTGSRSAVHYMYRSVSPEELSALYRVADVMVVTPIRDGMNLVAKEFVASRIDNAGTLILSRFAGAASELGEATIINPWDVRETSRAIVAALESDQVEQSNKMKALRQRVQSRNVLDWQRQFLHALKPRSKDDSGLALPGQTLRGAFQSAKRALLLLDYDGTLVPSAAMPALAVPDAKLRTLLSRLAADERCQIVILSGRDRSSNDLLFTGTEFHFIAEHGFFLRERGSTNWQTVASDIDLTWRQPVREVMVEYTNRTPNTWIEDKQASLAWHYRSADEIQGRLSARELSDHLSDMFKDYPLQVLHASRVVEVRALGIHKGIAYKAIAQSLGHCDFILAAGDDRTDEELFKMLPPHAWTLKIGDEPTSAKYRCPTIADFRIALEQMTTD